MYEILISIIALTVSLVSICISIRESDRNKPKLKICYVDSEPIPNDDPWLLWKYKIYISNQGYNPITIAEIFLENEPFNVVNSTSTLLCFLSSVSYFFFQLVLVIYSLVIDCDGFS